MSRQILVKLVSDDYHFQVQTTKTQSEHVIAEMVLQLGRAACCENSAGLNAAQWSALRYFSRANRFSRTVSAFAAFHHTTKGTASQTVKSLVSRGLLTRTPSQRDGRSATVALTEAGRAFLRQDPFEALVDAVARLTRRQRGDMAEALGSMLEDLACGRGKRRFGRCTGCSFLCYADDRERRPPFACGLAGEFLQSEETRQICVNFHPQRPDDAPEFFHAEGEHIEAQP